MSNQEQQVIKLLVAAAPGILNGNVCEHSDHPHARDSSNKLPIIYRWPSVSFSRLCTQRNVLSLPFSCVHSLVPVGLDYID